LAEQVATLAQGTGLAPVRQEAYLAQALEAMRQDMQEKAPDKLMGLQAHGLHLIALAPIAICAADAAMTDISEAMIGNRNAVGIAAQIVEDQGWPHARLLGIHHPRLTIRLDEEVGEARGRLAQGECLGAGQRPVAVGPL
jgi:hypothetical protein